MQRTTLNTDEVAEYLGISKTLVYTLVREQRIPFIRLGKRLLFKLDSIDRWLKENENGSIA